MRRSFVIVRPDGHPRLCREASIPDSLVPLQAVALVTRAELQSRLHADQTSTYRQFHGTVEGHPGRPPPVTATCCWCIAFTARWQG